MISRRAGAAAVAIAVSLTALPGCREPKKDQAPAEIVADTVHAPPQGPLFVSKEGGFSARLPYGFGMPERETAMVDGVIGHGGLTVYTAEVGEHAVMLGYASVPAEESNAKARLDSARDAAIRSIGATLVHETELERDGHPGRSITLTVPTPAGGKALGRVDFYLIDGRIYELCYITPTRQDFSSPDVGEFFESFELR